MNCKCWGTTIVITIANILMATKKKAAKKKAAKRSAPKKKSAKKAAPKKKGAKKASGTNTARKKSAPKKGAKKKNKLGVKNSLVNNINARKRKKISRPKKKTTVSGNAYRAMLNGWNKK